MTPPQPPGARHLVALLLLVGVLTGADLWSKAWTAAHYRLGERVPVVGQVLAIHISQNEGSSWGILSGRRALLVAAGLAAVAVIVWFFLIRLRTRDPWMLAGVGMLLGGAIGNLHDRIRFGYVRDFIEFMPRIPVVGHWPVFNVADACLCVGVALVFLWLLRSDREKAGGGDAGKRKDASGGS